MTDIGLCAIMFSRNDRLRRLLDSVTSSSISTVYIADNGEIDDERAEIYDQSFPFDLEVLDLEFDVGQGFAHSQLTEHCEEDYLLLVDNDMEVPDNVELLAEQLDEREDIGGISGILLNKRGGTFDLYSGCHDLFERETYRGTVLLRDILDDKPADCVAGAPLATFDFIVNAAMFRTEVFETYNWDPELKHFDHIDFYTGQLKRDEWTFGVSPNVVFNHYPGGSDEYVNEFRHNPERQRRYRDAFLEKWGFEDLLLGHGRGWGSIRDWVEMNDTVRPVSRRALHLLSDQLSTNQYVLLSDIVSKSGIKRPLKRIL